VLDRNYGGLWTGIVKVIQGGAIFRALLIIYT